MGAEIDDKKPNWFVRILIILLCFFIAGLIYFNFILSYPPAKISGGLLVLVAFLTVLVLSESFDNFSITKVLTLSRTIREKEVNNQELKKENTELRNQIINISTNISQKQVNATYVLPSEAGKLFTVKQADQPEREEKRKETEETTEEPPQTKRHIPFSKFEEIALQRFLQVEKFLQLQLVRDAKLVNLFESIDPISEYSPIFDGYINTVDAEIFIEMRPNRVTAYMRERIYIMLSKINFYRNIKKVNACLYLVLVTRPDEEQNSLPLERLLKEFEPAKVNGLLQIKVVEITQQEYDAVTAS